MRGQPFLPNLGRAIGCESCCVFFSHGDYRVSLRARCVLCGNSLSCSTHNKIESNNEHSPLAAVGQRQSRLMSAWSDSSHNEVSRRSKPYATRARHSQNCTRGAVNKKNKMHFLAKLLLNNMRLFSTHCQTQFNDFLIVITI